MNPDHAAQSLAQLTGADSAFFSLVQLVTRRVVPSQGLSPEDPGALQSPEALLVQTTLSGLYPAFEAFYARLFLKHVGEQHAPVVLEAMQSEPMRGYLRARIAMKPELAVGLQQLTRRMGQIAL